MNLDVIIPSLLIPASNQNQIPPPVVPAVERLLARADRNANATSIEPSGIFETWGVNAPYPLAAVLAEYDRLDTSTGGWMFAEPVHLIADRDRLTMFPAHFLELDKAESDIFILALNSHFVDRSLQFFAPAPGRWYVRCPQGEIPSTTSPSAARIGSLTNFQPKSTGALDWRSLQNEAQMLFFEHPVNVARESKGKPTASGIWFWAGGVRPKLKKPAYDLIVTSSPLAVQLARSTGIEVKSLPWQPQAPGPDNVLAVIDSCEKFQFNLEFELWSRELEQLDREWFLPISVALAKGTIQRLRICVPDDAHPQQFELNRRNQLLRFWRRTKPLSSYA